MRHNAPEAASALFRYINVQFTEAPGAVRRFFVDDCKRGILHFARYLESCPSDCWCQSPDKKGLGELIVVTTIELFIFLNHLIGLYSCHLMQLKSQLLVDEFLWLITFVWFFVPNTRIFTILYVRRFLAV